VLQTNVETSTIKKVSHVTKDVNTKKNTNLPFTQRIENKVTIQCRCTVFDTTMYTIPFEYNLSHKPCKTRDK